MCQGYFQIITHLYLKDRTVDFDDILQKIVINSLLSPPVPPLVHGSAIFFMLFMFCYSSTIIGVLVYATCLIKKSVECQANEQGVDKSQGKFKHQPVKYALLIKHTVIGVLWCISLSVFAFCVEQLTRSYKSCEELCEAFLGMYISLTVFMFALFASQMSLYHMVYEQIQESKRTRKLQMLQHGGINYEVVDVLNQTAPLPTSKQIAADP